MLSITWRKIVIAKCIIIKLLKTRDKDKTLPVVTGRMTPGDRGGRGGREDDDLLHGSIGWKRWFTSLYK